MYATARSIKFGKGPLRLILFACAGCLFLGSLVDPSRAGCPPGVQWKQIGPSPIVGVPGDLGVDSGLVRDIAIDPSGASDQTIYIATDNGGIWKTTDGGNTWSSKTDFMPSLSMGAVALDPGNPSIVYAGTGNYQNAGFYKGVGIYKSTDGGDTWTIPAGNFYLTNQPPNSSTLINRIALPASGVVLVATFTYNSISGLQGGGVFKSVDGGAHFGNNPPNFDNGQTVLAGAIWEVAVDTADPSVVYASVTGSGIYKSSDQGTTFPVNLFTAANGAFTATDGSTTTIGFIAFAQSTQPNNQSIYASVQLTSGGPTMTCSDGTHPPGSSAMLKSSNGGATWTYITLTGDIRCSYQVGYDQTIGVDPQDANRVYIGMRALFMATDGGAAGLGDANRIDLNLVHSDQHALVFSPPNHRSGQPTRLYNGTDGGIATTADSGNSWTLLNGSVNCAGPDTALATALIRHIDIGRGSTANNVYTYGAFQDNGINSHQPNCQGTPWQNGLGGDASTVAVDPRDPTHAIGDGDGSFNQATSGGNFGTSGGAGLPSGPGITQLTQAYFDPNGGIVYALAGGANVQNQLYQSLDNGNNFSVMHAFTPTTSSLTTINMVSLDSNTIWVGLSDGKVWRTSDANDGASAFWAGPFVPGGLSTGVSGIAIDPSNTAQVVVVYPSNQSSNQVFTTPDYGTTWVNISGNLPNVPVRAVVIDPNTSPHSIIVSSDTGVMRTVNMGATWETLGAGLPTVQCTSLAMDSSAVPSLLRVGTYGRSAFELAYDRQYVDWRNNGTQDGTREHPWETVTQAVNASATGDARYIVIQAGDYPESPLTITQCGTLTAINGPATIH